MHRFYFLVFICLLLFPEARAQSKWELQEPAYRDSPVVAQGRFYLQAGRDLFVSNKALGETYARKALALAKDRPELAVEYADLHNLLGIYLMYGGHYDDADQYYATAIRLARTLGEERIVLKATINIALNSTYRSNYQQSVVQGFEALHMAEKLGDERGQANALANLSNAYYYLNRLAESETYQLQALDLFLRQKSTFNIANAYNTLGSIYTDQKKYESAIRYFRLSAGIKRDEGDSVGLANTLLNIGTLYDARGDSAQTLRFLREAQHLYVALHDRKGLSKVYTNLGNLYNRLKDYRRARAWQDSAIHYAEAERDDYLLLNLYKGMSLSYEKLHEADSALRFSKQALAHNDSVFDIAAQRQVSEMQTRYDAERRERSLSEERARLAQTRLQLARRNYLLAAGLLLFLLAGGITFWAYRRHRALQESRLQATLWQQQEQAARAVLEAEEGERRRIAKDLHDGVGQLMSAARMNLSAFERQLPANDETRGQFARIIALVDDSCREVRTVSHNMMPNALLKNSLAGAVREFVDRLDHRSLQVHLYTEGLDRRLDPNVETVLYRIIQECVNNVIRHAGADTLDLTIVRDAAEITLTIEDNGRGFFAAHPSTEGMGLRNIRSRVAFLRGSVDFQSQPGKGTLVAVWVPLQEEAVVRES